MENEKDEVKEEIQDKKKKGIVDIVDTIVVRLILILLIIGFIMGLYLIITTKDDTGIAAIFETMIGMSSIVFCGIGLFIYLVIKIMKK